MPSKKAKTTDKPITVLIESTCPTSSGKSNLGYQVGTDDQGNIHLKIASNDGGGFFSDEWVEFSDIQQALGDWPEDKAMTSFALKDLHRGRSSNNAGFLMAVLRDLEVVRPMEDRKRCFEVADIKGFLAQVKTFQGKGGAAAKQKPKRKAKAKSGDGRKSTPKSKKPG